MSNLKIIWINTIVFFFGWNAIMLAGADFPPPIGFIWVVLLISMLDFIQYKYLQYFLPQLIKRKHNLFVKNLIFFVTGGMAVSILILATRYKITLEAIENPQKNYLIGYNSINQTLQKSFRKYSI